MKRISSLGDFFAFIAVLALAAALLYEYGQRTDLVLAQRWSTYGSYAWTITVISFTLTCLCWSVVALLNGTHRKRQAADAALVKATIEACEADFVIRQLEAEKRRSKLFAQMGVRGAGYPISRQ